MTVWCGLCGNRLVGLIVFGGSLTGDMCEFLLRNELTTFVGRHAINRLKPNDPYMGRTAPLTSKRCILYIY